MTMRHPISDKFTQKSNDEDNSESVMQYEYERYDRLGKIQMITIVLVMLVGIMRILSLKK
jgi:hypothetical protein